MRGMLVRCQIITLLHLWQVSVEEGLLYAGTDDGFIQISENGGKIGEKYLLLI